MVAELELNKERLGRYKSLAMAFSYPEGAFFDFFPEALGEKEGLVREYDRLFRAKDIWLYGTEYMSEHEFQRSNYLADISGFYKAFGVEVSSERPDALNAEMEFMHYLIFKEGKAPTQEKAEICLDAQKKFFTEHLSPAAKAIAQKIIATTENPFYKNAASELIDFLSQEEELFNTK
jgi:TorA maturation chaperone TorD